MNRNSNALAAAIAATLGAGVAQAATTTVTLNQWATYSNNGSSPSNFSSSTATWEYDDVAGTVTQTGGTLNARFTTAPTNTLFRQTTTGLVIGNGAPATATTFSCIEGNFGAGVGASICGNYNFGANFVNESTLTYAGFTVTRTLNNVGAGSLDDGSIGQPQGLADLNTLTNTTTGTSLVLTNAVCTLSPVANCTTITGNPAFNKGFKITFQLPVPADAVDDTASTHLNTAAVIDILANDTGLDLAANKTTVTISTAPADGGAVVITNDGATATSVCADPCTDTQANIRVKYTPNKPLGTATYTETFGYTVTNVTSGLSDSATVSATVNNAVPVANDANATGDTVGFAPASTTIPVDVTTIASNNLGDATTVVTKTDGTNGTVTVAGNVLTYTPNATFFTGTDSFTYTITDGDTEADTGTVSVDIPDASPDLTNDAVETDADTAVDVDLTDDLAELGNGSLAQHSFYLGPVLTAVGNGDPANGTCEINGTVLTYTPNAGFTGTDTCAVAVEDGDGSVDPALVTITVNEANTFTSTGLREDDGGSSADWLILSLLGGSALLRRRRRAS